MIRVILIIFPQTKDLKEAESKWKISQIRDLSKLEGKRMKD
jgi:hypothetical protein